jgi:hypothetical protein
MTGEEHAARIRPFLSKYERARADDLAPGSKRRLKLVHRLCHRFTEALDWRLVQPIAAASQSPEGIARQLRTAGAESTCYVLCADGHWDGTEVPLLEALTALVGVCSPVLLICGRVAYFEPEYEAGEGRRYLLCTLGGVGARAGVT